MAFFNLQSDALAVITSERQYRYNELPQWQFERSQKSLILIICDQTVDCIAAYAYAMNSPHAVMLLSSDIHQELLSSIIEQYQPYWIIGLSSWSGYTLSGQQLVRQLPTQYEIHDELALLLSTSGTTGSQKFVRLSYENLIANAESIVQYLQIDHTERAMMNLPLSYSYGMSIVNSHFLAGASIVLTNESVMQQTFWHLMKQSKATSLAGVPFTYQMLQRVGFVKMNLPYLKTLTQAGGRLNEKLVRYFGEYAKEHDKRFYVMYGQTEAAPRMSYIPYEKVLEKAGSIGIPVPDGELTIEDDELVYHGRNVMMGYAQSISDLAKPDEMHGVLHTGDTATVDDDGYFTITGRMKRFIKLFGLRINLDDVEKKLEAQFHIPLACTGSDDKLIVVIEDEIYREKIKETIESLYHLHKSAFKIKVLEIPHFSNGKTDYVTLKELCL